MNNKLMKKYNKKKNLNHKLKKVKKVMKLCKKKKRHKNK